MGTYIFVFVVVVLIAAWLADAAKIRKQGESATNVPAQLDELPVPRPLDLAQQANGPIAADEYPFAVIDLETTGFDPRTDRIVEVAVVRLTGDGHVWSRWSTLVNPDGQSGAEDIHGLTADDLRHAPMFAQIAEELVHQLSGAIVVAHNASFENRFLGAEFARIGVVLEPAPAICTLALARKSFPHFPKHTMKVCCEELGIVNANAHTAGADADATALLLVAALRRTHLPSFASTPWAYTAPAESHALPRGGNNQSALPPMQVADFVPVPAPWSADGLSRVLRRGGFIAYCPAEGSLPSTPGHLIDSTDGEKYVVAWSDPDTADRQCTKMGKVLRDAGYAARVNRSDGVCVQVREWHPSP